MTVIAEYHRRLEAAIQSLVAQGLLSAGSSVETRNQRGAVFALSQGYRGTVCAGGALRFVLVTPEEPVYAMGEGLLQIEIPVSHEPTATLLVRWMPVVESPHHGEVVAELFLGAVLPLPSAEILGHVSVDGVIEKMMEIVLARAAKAAVDKGYRWLGPSAEMQMPVAGVDRRFSEVRSESARRLLVAVIAAMEPREHYHGFWGATTFGTGWQIILAARQAAGVPDRPLEDWTGRFEIADLEDLRDSGYIAFVKRSNTEFQGSVTAKAFDEYDRAKVAREN